MPPEIDQPDLIIWLKNFAVSYSEWSPNLNNVNSQTNRSSFIPEVINDSEVIITAKHIAKLSNDNYTVIK